jgi:hypothetical protein
MKDHRERAGRQAELLVRPVAAFIRRQPGSGDEQRPKCRRQRGHRDALEPVQGATIVLGWTIHAKSIYRGDDSESALRRQDRFQHIRHHCIALFDAVR